MENVVSQGEELLSAPVRIVRIENGKEIVWEKFNNFIMNGANEEKVFVCSSTQSLAFVLNVTTEMEFDGCANIGISIMPRGRNVLQCVALEGLGDPHLS